jgi:hypothetical protein
MSPRQPSPAEAAKSPTPTNGRVDGEMSRLMCTEAMAAFVPDEGLLRRQVAALVAGG